VKSDSVVSSLHKLKVEFRFPTGIESVCLLWSIQASSDTYPVGTTGSIPRDKDRGLRLVTILHQTQRLRMRGVIPPLHHIPSWSGQGQPYFYFIFVCFCLFVCLFTQTFYAYVRSLTELADPRQNVFCSSVTALRTKIWSKYNCCKRFMTWQLIIRHLLLTCITSYTHTHTHTHNVSMCFLFVIPHYSVVSCSSFRFIQLFAQDTRQIYCGTSLVPAIVPRLGDSDLKYFWLKKICCDLVGWYQRFAGTRFLHLQRQHAPPHRWQH
jgi:hypothetical protein